VPAPTTGRQLASPSRSPSPRSQDHQAKCLIAWRLRTSRNGRPARRQPPDWCSLSATQIQRSVRSYPGLLVAQRDDRWSGPSREIRRYGRQCDCLRGRLYCAITGRSASAHALNGGLTGLYGDGCLRLWYGRAPMHPVSPVPVMVASAGIADHQASYPASRPGSTRTVSAGHRC
jgi:hypothetical protein